MDYIVSSTLLNHGRQYVKLDFLKKEGSTIVINIDKYSVIKIWIRQSMEPMGSGSCCALILSVEY